MAGKKQSPSKSNYSEFDEDEAAAETWDEEAAELESDEPGARPGDGRCRDWRDVERYREERALRKLIEDDFGDFDEQLDGRRRRR